VVGVLGQTSEGPDALLTEAGRHVLAAIDQYGVDRFVTLVGAGVREEGESVTLGGRVMGTLLKLVARSVLEDARNHVETVRASDTRWTNLAMGMGDTAARANVAGFILDCLEDDLYVHEMPKVADA